MLMMSNETVFSSLCHVFPSLQTIEVIQMDEDLHGPPHLENGDAHVETPCLEKKGAAADDTHDITDSPLIYKISDRPPVHLMLFFGFQV